MRRPRPVSRGGAAFPSLVGLVIATAMGFAGGYGLMSPDLQSGRGAFVGSGVVERIVDTGATRSTSGVDCDIKVNISVSTGARIYHLPGQRYYDETQIGGGRGARTSAANPGARRWRRSKV